MKPAARPFAWRLAVVLCRYNLGASALSKEFPQDFDLLPSMASGRSLVGLSKQPPPLDHWSSGEGWIRWITRRCQTSIERNGDPRIPSDAGRSQHAVATPAEEELWATQAQLDTFTC